MSRFVRMIQLIETRKLHWSHTSRVPLEVAIVMLAHELFIVRPDCTQHGDGGQSKIEAKVKTIMSPVGWMSWWKIPCKQGTAESRQNSRNSGQIHCRMAHFDALSMQFCAAPDCDCFQVRTWIFSVPTSMAEVFEIYKHSFTSQEQEDIDKLKEILPKILEDARSQAKESQSVSSTLWGVALDKDSTDPRLSVILIKFLKARLDASAIDLIIQKLCSRRRSKNVDRYFGMESRFWCRSYPWGIISSRRLHWSWILSQARRAKPSHLLQLVRRSWCGEGFRRFGTIHPLESAVDGKRCSAVGLSECQPHDPSPWLQRYSNHDPSHPRKGVSMFSQGKTSKAAAKAVVQIMQDNYPEFLVWSSLHSSWHQQSTKFFVNIPRYEDNKTIIDLMQLGRNHVQVCELLFERGDPQKICRLHRRRNQIGNASMWNSNPKHPHSLRRWKRLDQWQGIIRSWYFCHEAYENGSKRDIRGNIGRKKALLFELMRILRL